MIHVFDRFQADQYFPLDSTIAIRCLSSPNGLKAQRLKEYEPLRGSYAGVLELTFDDINPDEGDVEDYVPFNKNMARQIKNFVDSHLNQSKDILLHCDRGLSRSCAVGAALGDHYGMEYDNGIWHRMPGKDFNLFVYNMLTCVLGGRI